LGEEVREQQSRFVLSLKQLIPGLATGKLLPVKNVSGALSFEVPARGYASKASLLFSFISPPGNQVNFASAAVCLLCRYFIPMFASQILNAAGKGKGTKPESVKILSLSP